MATVMASEELAHGQITSGRSPRAWNTLRKASQEDIDPVAWHHSQQIERRTNGFESAWTVPTRGQIGDVVVPLDIWYILFDCTQTHTGWLRRLQSACAESSSWCLAGLFEPAETSACLSTSPRPPALDSEHHKKTYWTRLTNRWNHTWQIKPHVLKQIPGISFYINGEWCTKLGFAKRLAGASWKHFKKSVKLFKIFSLWLS